MPTLFPTFDLPSIAQPPSSQGPTYNGSFLFDFSAGEFVLDGAGRVARGDGYQTWVQWCAKSVLSERLAHVIYSDQFGVEMDAATKQPTRALQESEMERTITEALQVDDRTLSITDFAFTWQGDGAYVTFTANPTVGTSQRVEVFVGGN